MGDNGHTDVLKAKENGITAIHYQSAMAQYRAANPDAYKEYEKDGKTIEASKKLGWQRVNWINDKCQKSLQ